MLRWMHNPPFSNKIKRADLKCGMPTLKTGHYKKDYHELVTTSFIYYIMDFEMKKELN